MPSVIRPAFSGRARSARSGRPLDLHAAAYGLRDLNPLASAGHALNPPPALVIGPLCFILVLAVLFQGLVLIALLWAAALGVIMLSALRLAAALTPARYAPRTRLSNHELPTISVIIALYDEAEVLPGLIAALSRLVSGVG